MTFRLMSDYNCFPIWVEMPGDPDNIDPSTLPISVRLAQDLMEWAHRYDRTLCHENPVESGFESDLLRSQFDVDGRYLWRRLQLEFGESVAVTYFSELHGQLER